MTDSIAFAVRPHKNSSMWRTQDPYLGLEDFPKSMREEIASQRREAADTGRPLEVVPVIEGVELTDRIHEFERERGEKRASSYGGLIPAYFRFGSAADHYFATERAFLSSDQKIPLLGCECGEWGCWPLLARVIVDEGAVTWTDFEPPYRGDCDYSDFGPFVFRRSSYESAVADLAETWASE